MALDFDWDIDKDLANRKKHGLAFAEAAEVFSDVDLMTKFDWDHSDGEERFISLGQLPSGITLVVCHTIRNRAGVEVTRIISARKADKGEQAAYYEGKDAE
ncbi:MAG: BrnT family toxin [Spirochaetales bacterium]